MSKLEEKLSALKHPAPYKIKFSNFLSVILALLEPDPNCESESEYRSRDPIESGSGSTTLQKKPPLLSSVHGDLVVSPAAGAPPFLVLDLLLLALLLLRLLVRQLVVDQVVQGDHRSK
jgi:hypothetical protein